MFNKYFIEIRSFLGALILVVSLNNCGSPLPDEVQEAYSVLPDKIDYNFHVKPILSDRCYTCHGPDEQARKANLRLDIEEEAFNSLATGNRAFVRGSISSSAAIHRMVSDDPAFRMPPEESGLAMNSEEIAIIAKWLDQGAEWKAHWSFIPVQNSPIPEIPYEWARINPIDNFIQSKLIEAVGSDCAS